MSSFSCLEAECSFSATRVAQLRMHLAEEHGKAEYDVVESKEFECFEHYQHWKSSYEIDNLTWFVKSCGKKRSRSGKYTVETMSCNRSGHERKSRGTGKRQMKSQGTSKLGNICTCQLSVNVYDAGNISVKLYPSHYGHEPEVGHLRLSDSARKAVATKVKVGIPPKRILRDVRNISTCEEGGIKRVDLLTRQDIRNIKRDFGLKQECHSDDATSTLIMTEDQWKESVIFSKYRGDVAPTIEGLPNLDEDDVMLVIQTPLQAQLFLSYAENKTVCMDATHKTSGYAFHLITLLVIDQFGEGFPVAWCITSKENETAVSLFLAVLKKRLSDASPSPKWFMSDDASQYYNAWVRVFASDSNVQPKKLLCGWHVKRAWQSRLNSVKDIAVREQIYKQLEVLSQEANQEDFHDLLEGFMTSLAQNKSAKDFSNYFKTHYYGRPETWALSYRLGSGVNTNMFVEAFHRVLKHEYLDGKVNKRVDNLISTLMQFAKDKSFDLITKLHKGKAKGSRIHDIATRHRNSLDMSFDCVSECGDGVWTVKSSNAELCESDRCYEVRQMQKFSCCLQMCSPCGICVHGFSCTCLDSTIRTIICKHIHLVCRFVERQKSENDQHSCSGEEDGGIITEQSNFSVPEYMTADEIMTALKEAEPLRKEERKTSNLAEKCLLILHSIEEKLKNCRGEENLRSCYRHLRNAENSLDIEFDADFPEIDEETAAEPANKKMALQRPSVKKPFLKRLKQKVLSQKLRPPSGAERSTVKQMTLEGLFLTDKVKLSERDENLMMHFCSHLALLQLKKKGERVAVTGVLSIDKFPEDLACDESVPLSSLEKLFTPRAWITFQERVKEIRELWRCHACKKSTGQTVMIQCEGKCKQWFHIECEGIREEVLSRITYWSCRACTAESLKKSPRAEVISLLRKASAQMTTKKSDTLAKVPPPTKSIDVFLRNQDRLRFRVMGDGNCFFRALSVQLTGKDTLHKRLRSLIAQALITFRETYEYLWDSSDEEPTFESYAKSMKKLSTWASQVEIQAAADLFNVEVYVCSPHSGTENYEWLKFRPKNNSLIFQRLDQSIEPFVKLLTFPHTERDHIELAHTGCHYDSISRRIGEVKLPKPTMPEERHEYVTID